MTQNIVQASPTRLLSLDVFRGITVVGMILVNNPGSWGHIYAPLRHAEWHGCTPTDLIFPFFLFMVGVSITFALGSKKENLHTSSGPIILRILKRSLILFALGMFLALFPNFEFETVRIPGVLQRIAVVFFVSAAIFFKTSTRTQPYILAALLIIYWLLMSFIPVPGVGAPNLQPETNLGAWLDNLLLNGHLWKSSKIWDPEGILSTLPAIATGLSGVLTGQWLRRNLDAASKMVWLFVAGNLAILAGLAWSLFFPINKSLWTSSYVLYTSGLALNGLALSYWFIDVKGYKPAWLKIFVAFGVNAITAFMLSGLLGRLLNMIKVEGETGLKTYVYDTYFVPNFSPENASLVGALAFLLLCFIPIWIMYKRNFIIKV